MKEFFKSAWFKCTLVLLVISCVAGGLLAVLSDVLYVSPSERTARAMSKIYGESIEIPEENIILDIDSNDNSKNTAYENNFGKINKIYKIAGIDENTYDIVYQSTGYEGYKGGTITLWLKVSYNTSNPNGKFEKVVLESYDKQTLMSKLDSSYYDDFVKKYEEQYFTAQNENGKTTNVISGATKSSKASCNAINCIIEYRGGQN